MDLKVTLPSVCDPEIVRLLTNATTLVPRLNEPAVHVQSLATLIVLASVNVPALLLMVTLGSALLPTVELPVIVCEPVPVIVIVADPPPPVVVLLAVISPFTSMVPVLSVTGWLPPKASR